MTDETTVFDKTITEAAIASVRDMAARREAAARNNLRESTELHALSFVLADIPPAAQYVRPAAIVSLVTQGLHDDVEDALALFTASLARALVVGVPLDLSAHLDEIRAIAVKACVSVSEEIEDELASVRASAAASKMRSLRTELHMRSELDAARTNNSELERHLRDHAETIDRQRTIIAKKTREIHESAIKIVNLPKTLESTVDIMSEEELKRSLVSRDFRRVAGETHYETMDRMKAAAAAVDVEALTDSLEKLTKAPRYPKWARLLAKCGHPDGSGMMHLAFVGCWTFPRGEWRQASIKAAELVELLERLGFPSPQDHVWVGLYPTGGYDYRPLRVSIRAYNETDIPSNIADFFGGDLDHLEIQLPPAGITDTYHKALGAFVDATPAAFDKEK